MTTVPEPTYDVVSPLGRPVDGDTSGPRRMLPSLDGRRIAFVWDYLFKGPEFFAAIESAVLENSTGAHFLGYEQFGDVHGSSSAEREAVATLGQRLRDLDVDAAVVAVGA